MIRNETYSGGVVVAATIVDLQAGTIAFEDHGVVTSTRALTADEVTRYTPVEPAADPVAQLEAARTALAPLETVDAPYTTADIVDVLLDVRTALGG